MGSAYLRLLAASAIATLLAVESYAAPVANLPLTCSSATAIGQPQNDCDGVWAYQTPSSDLIVLEPPSSAPTWNRATNLASNETVAVCSLPVEPGAYSSCRDAAGVRRIVYVAKSQVFAAAPTRAEKSGPNIWVATDAGIKLVTSDGETLFSNVQVGVRPAATGFRGIAADPFDGGLWITNTNANRLIKLSRTATVVHQIEVFSPTGIAVDSRDGSVWTSELHEPRATRQVVKFSRRGDELVRIGGFSRFVSSISLDDRQGNIWVADRFANEIVRLTGTDAELNFYDASSQSGSRHVRVGGFDEPFSVSANPNRDGDGAGNAWAANRIPGEVVKLAPSGSELVREASPGFEIRQVEADHLRGDVWAQVLIDGLARYSSEGEELSFFQISTVLADEFVAEDTDYVATFDLDPYRGVVWFWLWVCPLGSCQTGAVEAMNLRGRTLHRFAEETLVRDVAIQSLQVPISIRSHGGFDHKRDRVVTVAVLSRPEVDPLQIDPRSARFGTARARARDYDAKDVNGDGVADLVLEFDGQQTGLDCDDRYAGLTAWTYDGLMVEGSDAVSPPRCGKN